MKIDIESIKGTSVNGIAAPEKFLWVLETDNGDLIPGNSTSWLDIWETCKKLNKPPVEPKTDELVS